MRTPILLALPTLLAACGGDTPRTAERVADLATNIGEDAVYLAEGKQIKHHFEALLEGARTPGS